MDHSAPNRAVVGTVWAVSLLPFVVLAVAGLSAGPGLDSGDYAHYLLHARALAEGAGYGNIGYIFVPEAWTVGPATQPPVVSLVLAPFVAAGAPAWMLRLVMLAFTTAFVVVVGRYFSRVGPWWIGPGVALLLGVTSSVLWMSSQVLSDLPLAAMLWCLILVYDRDGPWTVRRALLVSLFGAAAMGMRTAGLAVLPATAVAGALSFRKHGWLPLAPLGVWAAIGAIAVGLGQVSLAIADRIPNADSDWAGLLFDHALTYTRALGDGLLYPFPSDLLNDAYHVIAVIVSAIGLTAWIRRSGWSYALVFSVCYGAMLFSVGVNDGRYWLPLSPVVLFGLLNGVRVVSERLVPASKHAGTGTLVLGSAAVLAVSSLLIGPRVPPREFLADQPEVRDLFDRLREEGTEGMRVAFVKPRILTWETRIPAMATFDDYPEVVRGVIEDEELSHVILGDYGLSPEADEAFRAVVAAIPEAFALEFTNDEFEVYRVVRSGGDPERDRDP